MAQAGCTSSASPSSTSSWITESGCRRPARIVGRRLDTGSVVGPARGGSGGQQRRRMDQSQSSHASAGHHRPRTATPEADAWTSAPPSPVWVISSPPSRTARRPVPVMRTSARSAHHEDEVGQRRRVRRRPRRPSMTDICGSRRRLGVAEEDAAITRRARETPSWIRAPAPSLSETSGAPAARAMSMILRILAACASPSAPPIRESGVRTGRRVRRWTVPPPVMTVRVGALLLQAEAGGPVPAQRLNLVERALVEEQVDTFRGRSVCPLGVCPRWPQDRGRLTSSFIAFSRRSWPSMATCGSSGLGAAARGAMVLLRGSLNVSFG
ncbi:hypothetical protein SMICM304S_08073 [Streptomyces microflavus]